MKKKVILLVLLMVALILILTGCSGKERVYNAKVRYFDGTMEMIPVKKFNISGGFMHIETLFGDSMYIGANNIILLEEVEEQ